MTDVSVTDTDAWNQKVGGEWKEHDLEEGEMVVLATSDLHARPLRPSDVRPCHVGIFAGDATHHPFHEPDSQETLARQLAAIETIQSWADKMPHIVFTAGNHDTLHEQAHQFKVEGRFPDKDHKLMDPNRFDNDFTAEDLDRLVQATKSQTLPNGTRWHLALHDILQIPWKGTELVIAASALSKERRTSGFTYDARDAHSEMRGVWAKISQTADGKTPHIWAVHGPPEYSLHDVPPGDKIIFLDRIDRKSNFRSTLMDAILASKASLGVFGHIHGGYGTSRHPSGVLLANVSAVISAYHWKLDPNNPDRLPEVDSENLAYELDSLRSPMYFAVNPHTNTVRVLSTWDGNIRGEPFQDFPWSAGVTMLTADFPPNPTDQQILDTVYTPQPPTNDELIAAGRFCSNDKVARGEEVAALRKAERTEHASVENGASSLGAERSSAAGSDD